MGFRITMGMKMNTYRYNLMQSTNTLSKAQEKVETQRKFNSYAEDPANATNAWRVRRNYMDNISYRTETKDTTTRYQTAWLTMGTVKTHLEQYNGKTSIIRAANDPTGEAKKQLGDVLSNTADTVIQAMNGAKYGDEFVFGGTDGTSAPFSWKGDRLYYRGIDLTPPSMLPGGTQKWPEEWGELDPETGIPKNFDKAAADGGTSDWELVDITTADGTTQQLQGKYWIDKTVPQTQLTDGGTDPITFTLPVKDVRGNVILQQAVDANGNPAMAELPGAPGTYTPVVDANGNPVDINTFKLPTVTAVDAAGRDVTQVTGTPTGDQVTVMENGLPTGNKQELVQLTEGGNPITLPVKDARGRVILQQVVDPDGNPAMAKLANGTYTPVMDANGNPVDINTFKLPEFAAVDDAGREVLKVAATPVEDAAGQPVNVPVIDENGKTVRELANGGKAGIIPPDQKQWYVFFKNVGTLNELSKEIQYADLGMGQNEDSDGKIEDGTYFNNAIPGINILGYGVDEDGDPKNLALLMKKFDHVLSQVDGNGMVPKELGGNERVIDLLDKFDKVCDFTLEGYTKIDTEAKFLTSNTETLEDQTLNLNEQIVNLEQVDMADAITQFMWDYNCYNAALKIGTQLLSQSLLDYMA